MNHLADYSGEEMKTLRGRLFDPELKYNGGQVLTSFRPSPPPPHSKDFSSIWLNFEGRIFVEIITLFDIDTQYFFSSIVTD